MNVLSGGGPEALGINALGKRGSACDCGWSGANFHVIQPYSVAPDRAMMNSADLMEETMISGVSRAIFWPVGLS